MGEPPRGLFVFSFRHWAPTKQRSAAAEVSVVGLVTGAVGLGCRGIAISRGPQGGGAVVLLPQWAVVSVLPNRGPPHV